jgi:hypothetical protein
MLRSPPGSTNEYDSTAWIEPNWARSTPDAGTGVAFDRELAPTGRTRPTATATSGVILRRFI